MKKFIFTLLIFNAYFFYAQVTGVKFTSERTIYKHDYTATLSGPGNPNPSPTKKYYRYFVNGDSVSGGNYYQKLYLSTNPTDIDICNPIPFYKLMHYSGNKLFLDSKLIYDFNLVVNDTFGITVGKWTGLFFGPNHYTYTVSVRDSIYLGSKWRKRIQFTSPIKPWTVPQITWVEGVGDINYGFNCDYTEVQAAITQWGSHPYLCFYENAQNNFGSNCSTITLCGNSHLNSGISCNGGPGLIYFSISSGTPPYTYTIQPPSSCSVSEYTLSVASTGTTLPITCLGVYSFIIRDSNNSLIGWTTHTVTANTVFNTSAYSSNDTICNGQPLTLSTPTAGTNYTISLINWHDSWNDLLSGPYPGPQVTLTPSVNTNYSVTGLYTGADTKTCSVVGSAFVVVNACVGITELNFNSASDFLLYPNPVLNILNISTSNTDIKNSEIEISNNLGQTIIKTEFINQVDVSKLTSGFYTVDIITKENQHHRTKFLKE